MRCRALGGRWHTESSALLRRLTPVLTESSSQLEQERSMKEIAAIPECFVCGQKNEIGLKARFFWDGEKALCDITADDIYSGYNKILHGGIVATLLDEVMIKSLLAEGIFAVTAEITVRFKMPVHSGDTLHLEGWKTDEKRSVCFTKGQVINQKSEIVAEATARYVKPRDQLGNRLRQSVTGDQHQIDP